MCVYVKPTVFVTATVINKLILYICILLNCICYLFYRDLKNKYVEFVAMDFGDLKDDLFDLLVYPSGVYIVYVLAGTCTILMLIWINTRSFLDTVCLVLTIFIVCTLSVFIYSYVIPRTVFPFMNLLAIIAYSSECG